MTRPELRPLTSVRGLFAWAVVLYHIRLTCGAWMDPRVTAVLAKGYLAVDFFFLLSGFVIWLNYGERLTSGARGTVPDFLVRRLARVWPLHALMLCLALAIVGLLLATGRPAPYFPFAQLPLHFAMMQDWGFADALMWNDPAWSISAEWAAYLLVPLLAIALPRRKDWRTPALVAAALLPLLLLFAVMTVAGWSVLGRDIAHLGLVRCLCEFSAGTFLCDLWRRWRREARIEIGCWIAAAVAFGGWAVGLPETLCVPLAFSCALLGLATGAERSRHPLSGRAIHWLGEISYATYLSHFLLFFAFKLVFVHDLQAVSPATIGAFLLIELAASATLYHLIERPAQKLILRGWRSREGACPPPRPA